MRRWSGLARVVRPRAWRSGFLVVALVALSTGGGGGAAAADPSPSASAASEAPTIFCDLPGTGVGSDGKPVRLLTLSCLDAVNTAL